MRENVKAVKVEISGEAAEQRARLLDLRRLLRAEREAAITPAVERALALADTYLFLGLTYLGYDDELFPEEE